MKMARCASTLLPSDAQALCDAEIAQGWLDQKADKYPTRLADAERGKCIAIAAEYRGMPVGYVSVYPNCTWGALGVKGYSEIVDFAVLESYRVRASVPG